MAKRELDLEKAKKAEETKRIEVLCCLLWPITVVGCRITGSLT